MTAISITHKVFVDTSAVFAIYDTSDHCHRTAVEVYKRLTAVGKNIFIISTEVVSECLTLISQRLGKEATKEFITSLNNIEVVYMDEMLFERTLKEFKKIKSKNVSFADCFSFVVCRKLRIKDVFAFDRHFKQQGFKLLS